MQRFRGLALGGLVFAALACGGGGSDVGSTSSSAPVSASAAALPPEWSALGVSAGGGNVMNGTDTNLLLKFNDGLVDERAEAFVAPLDADGWKRTYDDANAETSTILFAKGDATIAVAASQEKPSGVYVSAVLTGKPPASSGAAPAASSASAPAAAAPAAAAPAPAPVKKKNCKDPHFTCKTKCDDVAWKCKTSCSSVVSDCADDCGDVQWECNKKCNETLWACEK